VKKVEAAMQSRRLFLKAILVSAFSYALAILLLLFPITQNFGLLITFIPCYAFVVCYPVIREGLRKNCYSNPQASKALSNSSSKIA